MAQNNTINEPQKAGQGAQEIKVNGITIENIYARGDAADAALAIAVAATQNERYKIQNNSLLAVGDVNDACVEADYGVLGTCSNGSDKGLCSCSKVSGSWSWRWVIS